MSTHDYVIDNQSAPAFRADLNNVLAAIASQNSSGTAPTVTFANMIWYDTTNNQIKKRNEANSAWITLGTIDETAGTFTPSGERALATQVQAEAGTDNTTLMTPLRTDQAMLAQFNVSGSAPTYACRAWVNFNGTGVVAINASGNVTSVTDYGTGRYGANFTTAMPDANYAYVATARENNNVGAGTLCSPTLGLGKTANQVTIDCWDMGGAGAFVDSAEVSIVVFR